MTRVACAGAVPGALISQLWVEAKENSRRAVLMGAGRPNERCSRQALFGCGFAATVVVCLQLN